MHTTEEEKMEDRAPCDASLCPLPPWWWMEEGLGLLDLVSCASVAPQSADSFDASLQ